MQHLVGRCGGGNRDESGCNQQCESKQRLTKDHFLGERYKAMIEVGFVGGYPVLWDPMTGVVYVGWDRISDELGPAYSPARAMEMAMYWMELYGRR